MRNELAHDVRIRGIRGGDLDLPVATEVDRKCEEPLAHAGRKRRDERTIRCPADGSRAVTSTEQLAQGGRDVTPRIEEHFEKWRGAAQALEERAIQDLRWEESFSQNPAREGDRHDALSLPGVATVSSLQGSRMLALNQRASSDFG
jgi:hypothetical protein